MDDRFQNQPWYIKLWRYRYYLTIPWETLHTWFASKGEESLYICWSISIGMACVRMKWTHTMEEIMDEHKWTDEERADFYKPIEEKPKKCFCDDCTCEEEKNK